MLQHRRSLCGERPARPGEWPRSPPTGGPIPAHATIILDVTEPFFKKTIEKIGKTKSWFFGNINKIDKPLAKLGKKKKKGSNKNQK